ncbi:PREDICTED: chondroitin sulfate proteoglycan 5 [Elephantulus edwardii]|uniref:chondroitin sulfate proteoglycan 5 n=1 Tax=Elephantulus edwardii TaxID=28737 RepID=UPI0003F0AEE1|nr:PREDICTED: chondroitin sulfate proteoglycan 5 [Elephantulus edwardii]
MAMSRMPASVLETGYQTQKDPRRHAGATATQSLITSAWDLNVKVKVDWLYLKFQGISWKSQMRYFAESSRCVVLGPSRRDALGRARLCTVWASGWATQGLRLIRLEPRPWASPPPPMLPKPAPPPWGPGDLPRHLRGCQRQTDAAPRSGRRPPRGSVRPRARCCPPRGPASCTPPPASPSPPQPRPSLRVSAPAASPPPSSPHAGAAGARWAAGLPDRGGGPWESRAGWGRGLQRLEEPAEGGAGRRAPSGRGPGAFARAEAPPLGFPPTAREVGSAVDAEELPGALSWGPRANGTREGASAPATGGDKATWTVPSDDPAAVGLGVRPEEALEASAAVTGAAWPDSDSPSLGGVTAEVGSGEAQALPATPPAPIEASVEQSSVPPAAPEASGSPSPTPAHEPSPSPELPKESPLEIWLNLGASTPDPHEPDPTDPPQGTREPQGSDILDIDYFEGLDGEGRGADLGSFPGPLGTSEHHPDGDPGGETPSWSLLDLYDDFTPFDESDFYPTTSFYDDLEEEEEEEEDKDAVGGGDLEDENDLGVPTKKPGPGASQPPGRWHPAPPQHPLGLVPGSSIALRPRPGEPGRDLAPGANATECRNGFVRHNGSCRSVCDLFPSYCHNGGQCYLVENMGAFCRCNTQDYIWHKGMRCESIITDFQVMCVAVGSAALVLLLLFMMTVFFAKKLYLLKTENTKLRRTNKFRTPSELHNDNFSLSTIAEGSHPNVRKLCDTPRTSSPHARALAHYDNIICQDDPSAPHKIQEVLKSCLKEEESFNIQNSMSPKLEGNKGDQADLDVNCLQNNLT